MSEREPPTSACEWPGGATDPRRPPESRVLRFRPEYAWEGVPAEAYKDPAAHWRDVARHTLVGGAGATCPFHVRYFEIAPGGYSSHEVHAHEHVVIPIRGRGVVRIGDREVAVGFGDVVYVAPNDPHQFQNPTDEPFGFLCIVPAERDPPRPWPPERG